MAFLTINGIAVSVAVGTFKEKVRDIGETVVAYSGDMSRARLASKRDISFETTPMSQAEAYALEMMVRGTGETWSFDTSLYSHKGNGPSNATGCSVTSTYKKHGASSMSVTSGNFFEANKDTCTYVSGMTALTWFRDSAGGTWTHYVVVKRASSSTIDYWTNGANKTTGAAPCYISAPDHTTIYMTPTGATRWWDDLVTMPCVIPDSWASQFYTFHNSYAFSSFPRLTLMGDCIQETTRTVMGTCDESVAVPSRISGSYAATNRVLSITLSQV